MTDRAGRRTPLSATVALLRVVIVYEVLMWRSFYRWIFRRPVAPGPGAKPFRYAALMTPLLIVFIVVSAIEIPVFHLMVPWEPVRLAVDLAGVYGLLWMTGLLAMVRVHPHVLTDDGLRVRNGATVDLTVPWTAVEAVRKRDRSREKGRALQVDGSVLHTVVMKYTNVDVALREPVTVRPRRGVFRPVGDPVTVTEIRLYADDPDALVACARERLAGAAPRVDAAEGQPSRP